MRCETWLEPLNNLVKLKVFSEVGRLNREELTKAIIEALNQLPAFQKEVFTLYHYKGLKMADIARSTKAKHAEVALALEDARKKVFSYLRRVRHKSAFDLQ